MNFIRIVTEECPGRGFLVFLDEDGQPVARSGAVEYAFGIGYGSSPSWEELWRLLDLPQADWNGQAYEGVGGWVYGGRRWTAHVVSAWSYFISAEHLRVEYRPGRWPEATALKRLAGGK
jgi:hypothetical protein